MAQLAAAGQGVFYSYCAPCHGDNGQGVSGPPVIGSSASLSKYQTAQGLLDFIDSAMPLTAPGSLTQQQYSQVLSYLLVQNKYLNGDIVYNAGQLKNIPLK